MRPAISTISLPGTLEEKLVAIAAAGFRTVDIFDTDLPTWPGTLLELRQHIAGLGLTVGAVQPLRDVPASPPARRQEAFDRAARLMDTTVALGSDLLMVCSNTATDSLPGIAATAADLHALGDMAAARDLRLCFEALAWGAHLWDYRDAWTAVRQADHPNVGLVLDIFHIASRGLPLDAISTMPGDQVLLVEVNDAPMLDLDHLTWSRNHRTLPGRGSFPLAAFMAAVRATGYDGLVALEVFRTDAPPFDVAGEAKAAWAAMAELVQSH